MSGLVWRVATHVRAVQVANLVVILDVSVGDYTILDRSQAMMWAALLAGGPLDADAAAFASDCEHAGFLTTEDVAQPAAGRGTPLRLPRWIPGWMPAAAALLAMRRAMRRGGFAKAYARLSAWHGGGSMRPLDAALVDFRKAEALLPPGNGLRDCLPRSLALFAYLRRLGHPAEHVIGVQVYPFGAHAWVECHGRLLLDEAGFIAGYVPLARLGG